MRSYVIIITSQFENLVFNMTSISVFLFKNKYI